MQEKKTKHLLCCLLMFDFKCTQTHVSTHVQQNTSCSFEDKEYSYDCVNHLRSYFLHCENRAWGNGCKDALQTIMKLCPFLVWCTLLSCAVCKGSAPLFCIIVIQASEHSLCYLCSQLSSVDQNLCAEHHKSAPAPTSNRSCCSFKGKPYPI